MILSKYEFAIDLSIVTAIHLEHRTLIFHQLRGQPIKIELSTLDKADSYFKEAVTKWIEYNKDN